MAPAPNTIAAELQRYLDEVAAAPGEFNWTHNNCCHFAGRWVARMTGLDALAGLGLLADARGARALLRVLGAGDLRAAVSARLARAPIPPLLAQLGDVVMVRPHLFARAAAARGVGGALGICAGRTGVFIDLQGAVGHVPMAQALAAWPLFPRVAQALAA